MLPPAMVELEPEMVDPPDMPPPLTKLPLGPPPEVVVVVVCASASFSRQYRASQENKATHANRGNRRFIAIPPRFLSSLPSLPPYRAFAQLKFNYRASSVRRLFSVSSIIIFLANSGRNSAHPFLIGLSF
jgi:hypothetical protein